MNAKRKDEDSATEESRESQEGLKNSTLIDFEDVNVHWEQPTAHLHEYESILLQCELHRFCCSSTAPQHQSPTDHLD